MKIENMSLLELLKLERDDDIRHNIRHVITNDNLKDFLIYRTSLRNHKSDTIDEIEVIYIRADIPYPKDINKNIRKIKQNCIVISDLIKFLETGETVYGEIKPTVENRAECDFSSVYTI